MQVEGEFERRYKVTRPCPPCPRTCACDKCKPKPEYPKAGCSCKKCRLARGEIWELSNAVCGVILIVCVVVGLWLGAVAGGVVGAILGVVGGWVAAGGLITMLEGE